MTEITTGIRPVFSLPRRKEEDNPEVTIAAEFEKRLIVAAENGLSQRSIILDIRRVAGIQNCRFFEIAKRPLQEVGEFPLNYSENWASTTEWIVRFQDDSTLGFTVIEAFEVFREKGLPVNPGGAFPGALGGTLFAYKIKTGVETPD